MLGNSPCIDAGDPALPRDNNGTVTDMGAQYYYQRLLFVNLVPHNPNIYIPLNGGRFSFDLTVESVYSEPYVFDFWTEAIMPGGAVHGPIFYRADLTIPAGHTYQRSLIQCVPASAPGGFYEYVAKVGFYPDNILDSDEFSFAKLYGGDGGNQQSGWNVYGRDDLERSVAVIEAGGHSRLSASPNPFNQSSQVSFTLEHDGDAELLIYDMNGRLVDTLMKGWTPSGMHQVSFNAASLPSGVYFARLTAPGAQKTMKLLYVK